MDSHLLWTKKRGAAQGVASPKSRPWTPVARTGRSLVPRLACFERLVGVHSPQGQIVSPMRRTLVMNKRYIVTLTPEERHHLEQLVTKGKTAARTLLRAWTPLKADAGPKGEAW